MRTLLTHAALIASLLLPVARAAEVITCDFARPPKVPWLQVVGDATVEGGVLKSAPQANWQRSGLFVGPLPMPGAKWVIEYDVKPVAFGAQCQEFVSSAPSTHWYMCYVRQDGHMNLHTKGVNGWQARGSSQAAVELGQWYHVTVELAPQSIRYAIADKETGRQVWDSGETAMDDLGQESVFGLIDEAPDTVGQTEWDNLRVSTDSPDVAARMAARVKALEEEQREMERRQAGAKQLREAGIALIPMPQKVELKPGAGSFKLTAGLKISGGDAPARSVVAGVLEERLGLKTVSAKSGGSLRLAALKPGGAGSSPQAYALRVDKSGVTLEARAPEGFFYAAQTLCQLAQARAMGTVHNDNANRGQPPFPVPGIGVTDGPAIEKRLVMIAVSQGAFQVIDTEYWKRMIRELAAVKINYIMPYFEGGSFDYTKYPFLTLKGADGFTVEKGKLLSEYAMQHFIRMVPQQQTLGHSGATLLHAQLKDLAESGDVFCSSNPKTFQFLGDLFDDLAQAFPYADYIHCGGDEFASGFAKCPLCKQRAEEIGKPGLYAEHMMKVHDLLQQRGRKMMIWWHEEGYTEEAADKLAKDISIFDWHYGNQATYPSLERLQSKGFAQTWATPAITRYYSSRDDWDETFGNVSGFMRAGAQRKVPGECTCTWVHGIWGGRNLFELNLYGLAFSGECAWNPLSANPADFRWKFGREWFGLSGPDLEQEVRQAIHAPYGEGKEQKFWASCGSQEEMLAPPVAKTAEEITKRPEIVQEAKELLAYCDRADTILAKWRQAATRNQVTIDFLAHDVHIHATVARRIIAVKSLMDAWERAKELPPAERQAALEPEIERLKQLAADYRQMEAMFDRSIHEAGGGKCGWGPWWPFVSGGGILFRAPQGREQIEKEIAYLTQALTAEKLPESVFP